MRHPSGWSRLSRTQELQKITLIGIATTWRRIRCEGHAEIVLAGVISDRICPYAIEHEHEDGCPDGDY